MLYLTRGINLPCEGLFFNKIIDRSTAWKLIRKAAASKTLSHRISFKSTAKIIEDATGVMFTSQSMRKGSQPRIESIDMTDQILAMVLNRHISDFSTLTCDDFDFYLCERVDPNVAF